MTAHGVEIVPVEVEVDPNAIIGLRWLRQRRPKDWSEPIAPVDDMTPRRSCSISVWSSRADRSADPASVRTTAEEGFRRCGMT